jgi:hypothetical protein
VGVAVLTIVLVFVSIVLVVIVIVVVHVRIVVSRILMSEKFLPLTARAVCARIQGVIVRLKRVFRIVGKTVILLFALDPDPQ